MSADALMRKAERSLSAARLLLENGFADEASSRAYYAMFDAARAALIAARAPTTPEISKSHSGLISAFGRYVVQANLVTREVGRSLGQAQHVRLIADYNGDPIDATDAVRSISWAADFLSAVAPLLKSNDTPPEAR